MLPEVSVNINVPGLGKFNLSGLSRVYNAIYSSMFSTQNNDPKLLARFYALGQKDPSQYKDACDLQEKIDILSMIGSDNVIVPDFGNAKTKKEIQIWQGTDPNVGLSRESVNFEDLVSLGYPTFKEVLIETTDFFNKLVGDKKNIQEEIEVAEEALKQNRVNLKNVNSNMADINNGVKSKATFTELLKTSTEQLRKQRASTQKAKDDLKAIDDRINHLKTSTAEVHYATLQPARPIVPRPWYQIINPTTYSFEHRGDTPIRNTIKQGVPGTYLNETTDRTELFHGQYRAEFLPAWCYKSEDCKAEIKLYAEERNLQKSKEELAAKENERIRKFAAWEKENEKEQKLEAKIQGAKDSLKALANPHEMLSNLKKTKIELEQSIQTKEDELEILQKSRAKAEGTLETYKDFCDLLATIVEKIDLSHALKEDEKAIFGLFKANFKTSTNYKRR